MILLNSIDDESELAKQFEERKFTRRNDLTADIRLSIATTALYAMTNNVWGTISQLAKDNNISRTFIYSLASRLKEGGRTLFAQASAASLAYCTAATIREYFFLKNHP